MSPYAVLDVGSNTIHLLVGEVENRAVLPVTGEKISARLGSGVDETGRIEEARISVAAEVIRLFSQLANLNGVHKTAVLATSAVRDAENGPALVEEVRERAGLEVRLISGEEEAILGFRGAASALGTGFAKDTPALVVDLGGGSLQLVLGDVGEGPEKQTSLPLGSNRLTERYIGGDPPKAEELNSVYMAVLETLPEWNLPTKTVLIAIGGSARAITKITKDQLTPKRLKELSRESSIKPSAMLAREEGLTPERARVLPAASVILAAILDYFGRPFLTVVRGGIREGMILTMAEEARNEEALTGRSQEWT